MSKDLKTLLPAPREISAAYALSKSAGTTNANRRNVKARRAVARRFLEWCGRPPGEITPADIMRWRAQMEAEGLSPATIYQRLSFISQLFEFCIDNGLAQVNPVAALGSAWRKSLRSKPYSTENVKAMTPQQVETLLAAIDRTSAVGSRLYAMVLVMLTTGMRAAEVCGILWKNTVLDGDISSVRTKVKGGEWVTFELTKEVVEAINDYLRMDAREAGNGQALFAPVRRRKKGGKPYQPLHPYWLWSQVKDVATRIGLPWVTVHTFRHTFAQLYHQSGASQPEVQGALGHKSGRTTRIYLSKLAPRSAKAGRAVQDTLPNGL